MTLKTDTNVKKQGLSVFLRWCLYRVLEIVVFLTPQAGAWARSGPTEPTSPPFINQKEATPFLAMVDYLLFSDIVDLLQGDVNDQ